MDAGERRADETKFLNEAASEIASEFDVPADTAGRWHRKLGDVESLKHSLGQNAPEEYLDLIRRREWIPYEQDERREELLLPLKQWVVERADGVCLVPRSEHQEFTVDKQSTGRNRWASATAGEPSPPHRATRSPDGGSRERNRMDLGDTGSTGRTGCEGSPGHPRAGAEGPSVTRT